MPSLDWGPFPQIATSLRLHPKEVPLAWLDRLGRIGSLWQNVANDPADGFWPSPMSGSLPAERPVFPWWIRWIWIRPPAPIPIGGRKFARIIPPCHVWLATENMRFLAKWLTPAPRDCFSWLAQTSDRALFWSLIAFAADHFGPDAIRARSTLLQNAMLDEYAAPGDLLVLHRHVEGLAKLWLERAGIVVTDRPARIHAGGLRTSTFPLALTALPTTEKAALELMASCSPLTRLAYLDLITNSFHASIFAPLSKVLPAYSRESAPWMALLANTLLGALLAPSQNILEWQRAEAELRQLEEESWSPRSFRLSNQRIFTERARAKARVLLLSRLESWAAINKPSFSRELQTLVLDRLARLAAVRATPAMRDEWRGIRRSTTLPDAKVELFRSGSAYYTELTDLLLAGSLNDIRQLLSTSEQSRVRHLLDGLLNLPEPSEPSDSPGRFWDDSQGVRLPLRPINDRGPHPAAIFSKLLVELSGILPPPQSVVEE